MQSTKPIGISYFRHFTGYLFVILFSLVTISCEKDEDIGGRINQLLGKLPPVSTAFPAEKVSSVYKSEEEKDQEYVYKIDYYSAAAGYDDQIVLNPQTDVIFPGALIKGESILDGSYILIPAKRKPITISTSLTGNGNVSVIVDDPKLSTVRTAINKLMNQEYNVPPANMGFTIEQAYSEEQLKLSLHASYSGIVDVAGGFDYSNKKIKTRLVAKFIQSYYTLDMDSPSSPSDLFDGNVNDQLFGTYMPMYVSSVTYGRMALFTIESELDETKVKTYLQGSYSSVEASSSADFEALKASSSMKVYILGGSGSDAGQSVDGFESFKNFIKTGGNFSKDSPGAPISYKLRYIKDNSIGKIVLSANYPIRTAIPRTDNIRYDIKVWFYSLQTAMDDWGTDCEMRGTIQSYLKSAPAITKHDHFTNVDMNENTNRFYPEDDVTTQMLNGLTQNDSIAVNVNLYEESDFSFPNRIFYFPVTTIAEVLGQSEFYDTHDLMLLWGGSWEHVIVRFKFRPTMRRIPDGG